MPGNGAISRVSRPYRFYYPVLIRIVTTSDWTTLRPLSGILGSSQVISASPEASFAGFENGRFRLSQSISRPQDAKAIAMVAVVNYLNLDRFPIFGSLLRRILGIEKLKFEIERGHWGWTHVQLANYLGDAPLVIENYWWCGVPATANQPNTHSIEAPVTLFFKTLPPRIAPVPDVSTLNNKMLLGYQGWFGCPGDGSDWNSWVHWFYDSAQPASLSNLCVDFWPDTSELDADELFSTDMFLHGGGRAQVFSSYKQKTVVRHFKWMQEYGIDGVFLQRFVRHLDDPRIFCFRNQVIQNVQVGAKEYGRVFAVMYAIEGRDTSTLETAIKQDWTFLVEVLKITESPNYLHHQGKPVVGIWGFGFVDRPNEPHPNDPMVAIRLIDWFHTGAPANCQAKVVGGIPTHWRTLDDDSNAGSAWFSVYASYDCISPWTVGRYDNLSKVDCYKDRLREDARVARGLGLLYMPVVWPGFSWRNLKRHQGEDWLLNQIPRDGGTFLWRQVYNAISEGVTLLYGAMFDEVDEGTAVFKLATTASQIPMGAELVPLNIDGFSLPSDWYLRLCREAGKILRGEIPLSSQMQIPIQP